MFADQAGFWGSSARQDEVKCNSFGSCSAFDFLAVGEKFNPSTDMKILSLGTGLCMADWVWVKTPIRVQWMISCYSEDKIFLAKNLFGYPYQTYPFIKLCVWAVRGRAQSTEPQSQNKSGLGRYLEFQLFNFFHIIKRWWRPREWKGLAQDLQWGLRIESQIQGSHWMLFALDHVACTWSSSWGMCRDMKM